MSMQSEVRPKQVQLLQKFQNSTETKTYQVVHAISEHYEDAVQHLRKPALFGRWAMVGGRRIWSLKDQFDKLLLPLTESFIS
jgi:hypothetical protein